MKALCSKVRKRCCVNKIFDVVERLVKCQMKTQERCLAIQDLKQTVEIAKKALPSAIPLVKDTLTTYALQRFGVWLACSWCYDWCPTSPGCCKPAYTFAVSLQKKAPKTEPVAPSYPPGTLGNLLVKTSRVRQFLGGPPTKNGPGAKKCGQNTPTGSYYSKSRHFCGVIAKKSAKNRAGGAKLPPRYFGKPACENQ